MSAPDERTRSVACATCGCGWWGSIGVDKESVEHFLERYNVRDGCYNSGPHNGRSMDGTVGKQRARLRAEVRKGQACKTARDLKVDLPIAKRFGNVIGVHYRRLLKLVGHVNASIVK